MFCTSCGIKNAADSNFCKQCGSKLDRAAAARINEDAFERAMPEDEQVSALLERAYRLRKENNLEGAIALCQEILRLPGDSTSAHSFLGQLYEQQGDREAAIREYERVLHLNPGSIADRVKLDELRGQTEPGSERKAHTRVVMADPQTVPGLGYARFTSAGVAIALLVLGGLAALQFRPHSSDSTSTADNIASTRIPARSANTPALNNTTASSASAMLPTTAGNTATDKTNGVAATASGPAAPNNAGTNTVGLNAIAANNPPAASANVPTTPPPVIIYKQAPPRYVQVPAAPSSNAAPSSRLPGIKPPKNGAGSNSSSGSSDTGNGSGRVVLNGDPDVVENNGTISVKVNPGDVPGKKKDPSGEGNGYSKIVMDTTPSGGVKTVPAPGPGTTNESRSFLTIGDEKKRLRDYRGAINAFTKALDSAGDQKGYILQQRALCFQQLNELASAKSDYENAISEYRKLEARDPETARNGVRACEKGIKLCGNQ